MAHIVVMGAGLAGVIMAYEMKDQMRPEDRITVVTKDPVYHFVPSNPWVAVGWRTREAVSVDLAPTFARRGIAFKPTPVAKVDPHANRLELADGAQIDYDYLVIATGPELAFDEIEGLGPHGGFTSSICHVDHALKASVSFEDFCKKPGPIITGAVQGASCYGPAYEYTFILDTELRRRKIRDRVPMTFVTSEPYVGHLGLDGVGDTKGLLEGQMREHHIKWMTSTRVKKVEQGKMIVEEIADDGSVKATRELPFGFSMMLPAFRGIAPLRGIEGLVNPRGFVLVDKHQRNPTFDNVFSVGVCVAIPPMGPTPGRGGSPMPPAHVTRGPGENAGRRSVAADHHVAGLDDGISLFADRQAQFLDRRDGDGRADDRAADIDADNGVDGALGDLDHGALQDVACAKLHVGSPY